MTAMTHPELVAACAKQVGDIRAALILLTVAVDHHARASAIAAVEDIKTAAASLWALLTDNGADLPETDL